MNDRIADIKTLMKLKKEELANLVLDQRANIEKTEAKKEKAYEEVNRIKKDLKEQSLVMRSLQWQVLLFTILGVIAGGFAATVIGLII